MNSRRPHSIASSARASSVAGTSSRATFWSSMKPFSRNPRQKPSTTYASEASERSLTNPTTGIAGCCALAASGQATAAEKADELAPLHVMTPSPRTNAEYSRSKPCIAAKAGRSCPVGVSRVGPKQAAASPDVRFASDSDQTGAAQRSDALCQYRK